MKLYEELAGHLTTLIEDGTLRELPRGADALGLHRRALDQGISVAPGPIFSPRREFRHCLRLNSGHPWTPELDRAVARLGQLVRSSRSGAQ